MSCKNHPNVEAIANCALCDTPMSGMCANFMASETLCEACVDIREAERFVSAQSQQLNQAPKPVAVEKVDADIPQAPGRAKSKSRTVQWMVLLVCFLIISVRLFTPSNTEYVPIDPVIRAQQLAIVPLDRCISIFREIGEILKNDRMPGESLRCDESGATNLVTRADGDIKISHPQPDFYGYREIYVSRNNPEPTLVQ